MNQCLQVRTSVKKCCLTVDTTNVTNHLNVKVSTFDKLNTDTIRIDLIKNPIRINAVILDKLVDVRCNRVCSIALKHYLNVTPNIVWLTRDMLSSEFNIISNVTWQIN